MHNVFCHWLTAIGQPSYPQWSISIGKAALVKFRDEVGDEIFPGCFP